MSFNAPNWRDAAVYPNPKTQPDLSFWAWQFLRRNSEYQADWNGLIEIVTDLAAREPEWRATVQGDRFFSNVDISAGASTSSPSPTKLDQSTAMWELDPPALPSERKFTSWLGRVGGSLKSARPLTFVLGEKWGIHQIQDPAEDALVLRNRFEMRGALRGIGQNYKNPDNNEHFAVEFDLRYPVEVLRAQFDMILKIRSERVKAKELEPYNGRPLKSFPSFANYLRVLDAVEAGELIPEIAKVLLPHQDLEGAKKAVNNWKKTATELSKRGYLVLPANGVPKIKKPKNCKES